MAHARPTGPSSPAFALTSPAARFRRVVRGWSVATVAVLGGLASHAIASGHLPGPVLVLLVWSLSGLLCVALAGRRRTTGGTAAGVLASQAGMHALLAQTGMTVVLSPAGSAGSAASGHAMAGMSMPMTASVAGHAHSMGPMMLLLHLLAAAGTLWAIWCGEAALAGLARAVRLLLERWGSGLRTDVVLLPRRTLALVGALLPRPRRHLLLGARGLRGPPALSLPR